MTTDQESFEPIDIESSRDDLTDDASRFDFFQAIRRIETDHLQVPRVGHSLQANQEAVRIHQTPAIDFAPSTIDRVASGRDGRLHVSQRFFGLLGPSGPMPLYLTEKVREQIRHQGDPTLAAFLNLFHHRMATLFYRAWSSSRGAIQRDRPTEDRFAGQVASLSGGVASGVRTTERSFEDTRLYFTGRFGSMHRNAEGLEAVVSATVQAAVNVQTFVLRHLRLQTEDRTLLTSVPHAGGRGGRLGRSVMLGRTVPDRRSLIDLEIGPIPFATFRRVLPSGDLHANLGRLIRSYVDPGIDCRVRLVLNHQTIPRMSLGRIGSIGQSAWINSNRPQSDVADCQFLI